MDETITGVKKEALKLLETHNCSVTDYEGIPVSTIKKDLVMAYPKDFPYLYSREDMADAIYQICTTDRGWKEPVVFSPEGDASKWGYTDLREDVRKRLEKLLISGVPFRTEELACTKECVSWRMGRKLTAGEITVSVHEEIDEGPDLVYDALPEGEELTDKEMDIILDLFANESECHYEYGMEDTVPGDSTLEDILVKVKELGKEVHSVLDNSFEIMRSFASDVLSTRKIK